MQTKYFGYVFAGILAASSLFSGTPAQGDNTPESTRGTRNVYGESIAVDQAEALVTGDQIMKAISTGTPTNIWETLERGERVECLGCISSVEPLIYDLSPATREIAAWWLRRRMFGVFGPGESYERTLNALKNDPSPTRRAYAAEAIGEFLAAPGVDACAEAIANDKEPVVRAAAAKALGRLNSEGNGALARALGDADASVRLAALASASRINATIDAPQVTKLVTDGDAVVRKRAIEVLDSMRAKDAAQPVLNLAKNDPDAEVRLAACHALGSFGDASVRAELEGIAASDKNMLVRDQARIAARRL
jgi:hypothetical protein